MRLNEFDPTLTESLAVGDPVIITGAVEFQGKTGDVKEIGRDGSFVVVDLYNYGPQSFQASDVSRNDYADGDDAEDVAEGVTPASVSKVLRLIQRHHPEWFDNYGMGEVEDTVVDMAEMGQFQGMSAKDALALVGQELESLYGQQGVAEVSKATIDRYVAKASDAHGDADFKARMSKHDPDKRSYHVDQKKTAEKRRQGISRALDRMSRPDDVAEQEKVGNMDADKFDAAMARLKQLAGAGPLKTVYDPQKRVYRNVPTAVQPTTQPKK